MHHPGLLRIYPATGQTDRSLGPTSDPTRYLATPREGSRIDSPHRHNLKPSPAPNPADKASVISLVRSTMNNCPVSSTTPRINPIPTHAHAEILGKRAASKVPSGTKNIVWLIKSANA